MMSLLTMRRIIPPKYTMVDTIVIIICFLIGKLIVTMFNSPKEIDNETNNDSTSVNTAEPRCL